MILLVPLGYGFSFMMIHLAKEGERKAKLAKKNGPQKISPIDLSDKWVNWVIIGLIIFLVFLNIAAYNAALTGMKNFSLFLAGLILFVFAGMFHVYRYGMSKANEPPPPPSTKKKLETKSIEGANMKELPPDEDVQVEASKSSSVEQDGDKEQVAPEIKANTADLKTNSEKSD